MAMQTLRIFSETFADLIKNFFIIKKPAVDIAHEETIPFETNGFLDTVEINDGTAFFHGWVTSMNSFPINCFRINWAGREFSIKCDPIQQSTRFEFKIPLNDE